MDTCDKTSKVGRIVTIKIRKRSPRGILEIIKLKFMYEVWEILVSQMDTVDWIVNNTPF